MNKPRFVISCPFDTYSGYGARSRDIAKAIIETNKYDVELLSQKWGETSWGFCKENPEWEFLIEHLAKSDWNKSQPDIWMQITIPNEFSPVGKFNIGCTAGIESTACKGEWVEGLNRMNLNWVSSNHAKTVFESARFDKVDKITNKPTGTPVVLTKPIEVIFEGVNLDVYKPLKNSELKTFDLSSISESFCYLFVGHWVSGSHGHDRKNVGVLVQEFFETFKNKKQRPALILKTSVGTSSYISRDEILEKIRAIKKTINSKDLPNVYLIDGEFSDYEMNELYNNPKIKAMVTITKGEGFGRPLLEFSAIGKPIIASGWSGHIDFLNSQYVTLLPGNLEDVHQSAANNWLIRESKWFQVSATHLRASFKDVFKKYKSFSVKGKQQKQYVKTNFSWDKMQELVESSLDKATSDLPKQVELSLPKLSLPKMKKLN